MDEQQKTDLDMVLNALMSMATPIQIAGWEEGTGNTDADLDAAMKRLGSAVGLDAGIL